MYSFYAKGYQLCCSCPSDWDKDMPREMAFVADKQLSIRTHKAYMLSRLMQMFEYKNLPETIPAEMLELQLLLNGITFITEVDGKLYALEGSPGGEPDPYYRPTTYVWANPALKTSREDDLWEDGILMRNDKLWLGLSPLMNKYAAILAENEITIRVADIMLRIVAMISSPDDTTKQAAEEYLKRLVKGKLGTMAENRFFDGVRMQSPPSNNGSYLTQFIELQQYMKASFYNEVGMQANYNMKRENIGSGETAMNQNATLPLCDQMLAVRREDLSRLNEKYGLNVSVEFASAWKLNAEQLRLELEELKEELRAAKSESVSKGSERDEKGSEGEERQSGESGESGSSGAKGANEGEDNSDQNESDVSDSSSSSADGTSESEDSDSSDKGNNQTSGVDDGEESASGDDNGDAESDGEDGDGSSSSGSVSESLEVSQLSVEVKVDVHANDNADSGDDSSSDNSEHVEGGEEDADK